MRFVAYASFTMASISAIEMIWLIHFIVQCEIMEQGKNVSLKNFFTPFSTILLIMIFFQVGLYVSEGSGIFLGDQRTSNLYHVVYSLEHLCATATEICYVFYSYLRAEPIFDQVFPSTSKLFSVIVKASPLLFAVQWIPYPLSKLQYSNPQIPKTLITIGDIISAINGSLLVAFDIVCLTVFIKYIRSTEITDGETDARFLIISRHGIASVVICLTSLCMYIVYSVSGGFELWAFIVYVLFSILFMVLVRMKVMLHRDKLEKEKNRRSRIQGVQRDTNRLIVKDESPEIGNASSDTVQDPAGISLKVDV
ncbi:hypothetical protein BDR26DRAFT_867360 [Obelidium mucronatum]|nr:hypothetical protein BDR26DRAFT_867360 [Obelidium mucronatum]